jgi:hypothetical protein
MEAVTCNETEVYEQFAILKNEVTALCTVDIVLLGQWKCEGKNRSRNVSGIHVLKCEAADFFILLIRLVHPEHHFFDQVWIRMNVYHIFCQVAVFGVNDAESSSSDITVLLLWPTPWTSCIRVLYTGYCSRNWSINAMDILTSLSLIVQ